MVTILEIPPDSVRYRTETQCTSKIEVHSSAKELSRFCVLSNRRSLQTAGRVGGFLLTNIASSNSVHFYPGNIVVHPILQEFPAVFADISSPVKQLLLDVDKRFGLTKRRHVQIRENVA